MKMVALLRGINVGGNRKVPMLELCAAVTSAGLSEVRSYINSGNLVFEAGRQKLPQVTPLLEKIIKNEFGFEVDVVVRTGDQWKKYADQNPYRDATRSRPKMLHLGLATRPLDSLTASSLAERAVRGEKVKVVGDAIWVDFAKSVGTSKLTPAWFEKAAGSPVTLRNWNTVLKLSEMLGEVESFS